MGTTHTYTYDVLGRVTSDAVTALGAGVDGAVRRTTTAYDSEGNPYLFTSYDAPSGGNVVNQVERVYNGLGQLTGEFQVNDGAVDTSSTPEVQNGKIGDALRELSSKRWPRRWRRIGVVCWPTTT
jgi:hypothetical protein